MNLTRRCEGNIEQDIAQTRAAIEHALWREGDIDLARVLISKLMGLRICAGERVVRLRAPVVVGKEMVVG